LIFHKYQIMTTPTQVIDVSTKAGKNFVKNINTLKSELKIDKTGDKTCQVKTLTPEQISENAFLKDFMNGSDVFKHLEVKNVMIGNFGRKGGWTFKPNSGETHFRFFIHLGSPEVYYLDDRERKDRMFPMTDGQGFIISSVTAPETFVTIYSDPIRIIHNHKIQDVVPKIRPRDYHRTTLVYDLEYNIPENELVEENEEGKLENKANEELETQVQVEDAEEVSKSFLRNDQDLTVSQVEEEIEKSNEEIYEKENSEEIEIPQEQN